MKNLLRPILVVAALATATAAPAFADNLITNGSFETGDFSNWTNTDPYFTFVSSSFDGYSAEDGTSFAVLGSVSSDAYISQTFSDTAGTTYLLSYYYASNSAYNIDGYGTSDFGASIDGVTFLGSVVIDGDSYDTYNLYTFTFVGTGSDTLTFNERDDVNYDALDNISVSTVGGSATPEPSSLVLLGTGILSLAGATRRKFRKA